VSGVTWDAVGPHSRRVKKLVRGRIRCGYVERLIGSIRHECLDHLMVFNAEDFRRILAKYYNEVRTHVSLGKDAPRTRPIDRFGDIVAYPILGGLHHRYAAMIFAGMVGSDEGRR
jgi:hypothetical protein